MLNYSRGPVNYPSNPNLFNQFSSPANYISNETLPYYTTPLSTGIIEPNSKINGLTDSFVNDFAVYRKTCN
jgi:hypothetical protein